MISLRASVALAVALAARPAEAWLLHEHDRLGAAAIRGLEPADRALLQSAWALATRSRPTPARYCADVGQGIGFESVESSERWCVGLSTLAALAGDHACVPGEVAQALEGAPWTGRLLVEVRNLSAYLDALGDEATDARRLTAWREHNLALQAIDPELVGRARGNISHFLPPLEDSTTSLTGFLQHALAPGSRLNAVAVYAHFHRLALAAAARGGCTAGDSLECTDADALWSALLAEGFALHFLEDAFSAGHVVGTWGDVGQRLGSHDYYSQHGLDVRTWEGLAWVAHGDAFLSAEDEARATVPIAKSLAQLIAALRGPASQAPAPVEPALTVCDANVTVPPSPAAEPADAGLPEVLRSLPIPSSRAHGHIRVASEVGPFFALSIDGSGVGLARYDGRGLELSDARLRIGIGPGIALEGAVSRFMDGQLFIELLLVTSMREYALGRPAIGFGLRIRLPFALFPGDFVYLVGPAALVGSEWGYQLARMAVAGGVGRIERRVLLSDSLSVQLMLGREATVSWIPEAGWLLEVPVAQLRGDHAFSGPFATESVLQLGAAFHWTSQRVLYGLVLSYTYRTRRFLPQE